MLVQLEAEQQVCRHTAVFQIFLLFLANPIHKYGQSSIQKDHHKQEKEPVLYSRHLNCSLLRLQNILKYNNILIMIPRNVIL